MGATKETILGTTLTNKILTSETVGEIVKTACTDLDDATDLPTAAAQYVGQAYMIKGVHYRCEDKGSGVYEWETYDTSGQNLNYADASGKPTINGVVLSGTMTAEDLELAKDAASRTVTSVPTNREFLIGTSELITYENLAAALNTLFGIANLPKYEKQFNPLLTSNGTVCYWEIHHTCKTSTPLVQLFTSGGIFVQSGINLIQHAGVGRISLQINSAVNIAANSYYIVLIG